MVTATAGEVMVVQFLHPGREHVPPADAPIMGWNVGKHRRKFLRVVGQCVDRRDALCSGTMTLWAEWEAQSRVLERHLGPTGPMPRWVHEPILARPRGLPARQNTDPFVFGDSFAYSNCRQFTARLGPTRLQRMPPGSIVLFGSHLDGQFVLDTVLVVASRTPYMIGQPDGLRGYVSPTFQIATLAPLAGYPHLRGLQAQLYRGVTYQDGRQGRMFSFAPARMNGARFPRPALHQSRFVNPNMTQGFKTTTTSTDQAQTVWDDIVAQVRGQDLDLAVKLAEPELLRHDPSSRPKGTGVGCARTDTGTGICTPPAAAPARLPDSC